MNKLFCYGFYNLNNQITDNEILNKITTKANHKPYFLNIIKIIFNTSPFEKIIIFP